MGIKKNPGAKMGCPLKYTAEVISQVGKDLLHWAEKDDAYYLYEFMGTYKFPLRTQLFSNWARDNPEFEESLQRAKLMLLGRLYKDSSLRKIDGNFVSKILPLVDMEFRQWRLQERQIEDQHVEKSFKLLIHPSRIKEEITKEITVKPS